jgi:hypothetical protein
MRLFLAVFSYNVMSEPLSSSKGTELWIMAQPKCRKAKHNILKGMEGEAWQARGKHAIKSMTIFALKNP